jgi:hypothetical protein
MIFPLYPTKPETLKHPFPRILRVAPTRDHRNQALTAVLRLHERRLLAQAVEVGALSVWSLLASPAAAHASQRVTYIPNGEADDGA